METFAVLNAVGDKLGQLLTRVLEKLVTNEEVLTNEEKQQLETVLGMDAAQIDRVVAIASTVFTDAASFGSVNRNLLSSRGVDEKTLHVVEKAWRKKGEAVAKQIAAHRAVDTPTVLQSSEWRLHLQMGSNKLSGQAKTTAIFQLHLASEKETERLDVELSHEELRSLFSQLNAIQTELDA